MYVCTVLLASKLMIIIIIIIIIIMNIQHTNIRSSKVKVSY